MAEIDIRDAQINVIRFADILNSLKLDSIVLDDCHSDVGLALVNNAINATTLPNIVVSKPSYTLVATDSGAKRVTLYVTHGIF